MRHTGLSHPGNASQPRGRGEPGSGTDGAPEAEQEAAAAAGDSITVAAWTIVSRVTGVARFACIGAVLGPTYFGNTYQFTFTTAGTYQYHCNFHPGMAGSVVVQ